MKEYFVVENEERTGPFSFEELKKKAISKDTLIWEDSFEDWKKAMDVPELKELIRESTPPIPIKKTPPQLPKKIYTKPPPNPESLSNQADEENTYTNIHLKSKQTKNRTTKIKFFGFEKSFSTKYIVLAVITFFVVALIGFSIKNHERIPDCPTLSYNAAVKILNSKYVGGGTNMKVEYDNCKYKYGFAMMDIKISFNGNYVTTNYYEIYGFLTIDENGIGDFTFMGLNSETPENIHFVKDQVLKLN